MTKKPTRTSDADAEYAFVANAGNLGTTGKELALLWGDGDQDVTTVVSSLEVADTDWHYVGVSFDAANDQVRFVVDGSTDTQSVTDLGHCVNNTADLNNRDRHRFFALTSSRALRILPPCRELPGQSCQEPRTM